MASPTLTSNFNGSVLDYIITEAVTGNQAYEKGSLYVMENVQEKISIAKMVSSSNPIGDREAMPSTKTATVTWSEATLTPADMMVYIPDINPRVFENAWREFQPTGSLPDKVLDPNVQRVFADVVLKQIQNQIGRLVWQGDVSTSGALKFFDGFVTRAAASSTNIDAANAGVLSATTIIQALENCESSIPSALYDDPDMVFHMSTTSMKYYQEACRDLANKGPAPNQKIESIFSGREIRHYAGFPENKILVARGTSGVDSHLYAAVDKVNDAENLVIAKLRPEGEHFFLKALFKMDVNFSIDSETVYYVGA